MRKSYLFFSLIFILLFSFGSSLKPTNRSVMEEDSAVETQMHYASFLPNDFTKINPFEVFQTKGDTLSWKLLGIIKYAKKPTKDYPEGVMFPMINSSLKEKNKKKIYMSGFIIPIDNVSYALSKNVFASCFFCGQAGPETIMGIKFKGATPKLKTDQYVTLEGTFRYNDDNVEDWIYHIENAVIVKGAK